METYLSLFCVSLMFSLWRVNAENVPRLVFFHLFKFNIKLSTIYCLLCLYFKHGEKILCETIFKVRVCRVYSGV